MRTEVAIDAPQAELDSPAELTYVDLDPFLASFERPRHISAWDGAATSTSL